MSAPMLYIWNATAVTGPATPTCPPSRETVA
jgi:hypothetical protein